MWNHNQQWGNRVAFRITSLAMSVTKVRNPGVVQPGPAEVWDKWDTQPEWDTPSGITRVAAESSLDVVGLTNPLTWLACC